MELQVINNPNGVEHHNPNAKFIEANTKAMSLGEMSNRHIIPVFVKDNEKTISHVEFVETMMESAHQFFGNTRIMQPNIRVSHAIKGRIPEAKNKPAKELAEFEKTIYYERCAFMIELPDVRETVNGETLSLVIGGVRALNETNLYSFKGNEKFKVFVGFKVTVCTNLCVWSDGYMGEVKVSSAHHLGEYVTQMLEGFQAQKQLEALENLLNVEMRESEFAMMLGRAKMYQYLPNKQRVDKPKLLLGDNQISMIAKGYYSDKQFGRSQDGSISLWNVYNLFTEAVKTSYIDSFLDRNVNAFDFVKRLETGLREGRENWFLS